MDTVLRVRNLEIEIKAHDNIVRPVKGVSFGIPAGKTVALVGESGSGKSMIANAIMRILPEVAEITKGEIVFYDPDHPPAFVDITKLNATGKDMRRIRGGRISIVFQEPMTALSPLHTIGDQISESLTLHRKLGDQVVDTNGKGGKLDQERAKEMTIDMLRLVGFPDPVKAFDTYPFELSGGLRQRAVIAMALICRPALLIADEPTTALDVTIQAQILKQIKDLQEELGMAVLIITHDLGVVANVADEVVVLYHGEVMESGTVDDIFGNPKHPYLKALLNAVPRFDMEPGERLQPIREIENQSCILKTPNENLALNRSIDGPLLDVRHVSKSFVTRKSKAFGLGKGEKETVWAVQDVSLSVMPGECVGLVGESGCGKTTLSKMILRALSPNRGTIDLHDGTGSDSDVLSLHGKDLFDYRRKVQFIFQDPFSSLNPRMTVFDLISEPLQIHKIGDAKEQAERVQELMQLVGLDPRFLRRYPHSFSGGQRQRIGIARALALQPRLLICDEPVSALDVSVQAQVLNLLKDLQQELGLTYLFISHNLAVVDYMADRIAVMCRGRLVETAPRDELFRNPVHPYTKALLAAVPKPQLGDKLDLTALMAGKASVPSEWPEPFRDDPLAAPDDDNRPVLIDLGGGHHVRAAPTATL